MLDEDVGELAHTHVEHEAPAKSLPNPGIGIPCGPARIGNLVGALEEAPRWAWADLLDVTTRQAANPPVSPAKRQPCNADAPSGEKVAGEVTDGHASHADVLRVEIPGEAGGRAFSDVHLSPGNNRKK